MDHVDIFGIVWAMRKERVWMVQTEQQYICIHQCLLAVLEGNESVGPQREIHDNQGFEGKSRRVYSHLLQFQNLSKKIVLIPYFTQKYGIQCDNVSVLKVVWYV